VATEADADRPELGDDPFDAGLTEADVDRVLALPLFRSIDPARFPPHLALRDLIRAHARIDRYERGQIIVRKGDYGHSAFIVLKGKVGVAFDYSLDVPTSAVRRAGRSWFSAVSQLWRNSDVPEARDVRRYGRRNDWGLRYREGRGQRPFLLKPEEFLKEHKIIEIGDGDMFGEIAALSRAPRNATVVAINPCELLELRWTGMREIRRRDEGFRKFIDDRYRSRSLKTHLAEAALFKDLDEEVLSRIAAATQFETYGTFEWHTAYKRQMASKDLGREIDAEPAIAAQGDYVDGLIMIRGGFARISERFGDGHRTLAVATTNDVFGLEEIEEHHAGRGSLALRRSLHAIGHVDILRVPTALVEQYVLPARNASRARPSPTPAAAESARPLDQALVDFLVDRRFVNGTQAMVINTERCVGCDDCVRACAEAHDNNPRFIRHGPEHGKLMVANACMHCRDPVCLIGCPTGAIHRMSDDGRVVIDDDTCIGCGTCVNSCPYNNIRLVEIRDRDGAFVCEPTTGAAIVKATKCDLCLDQLGGPACQRACPHDALVRIDIADQEGLARWVNR
jgi:Fe-S-cluster-containing dehydrogenase component/CRP-like cAMP-binding protein